MKLYHVSYDKIHRFIPGIPRYRLPGEDSVTPRICLSTSIERCINAKPHQAQALYLAREFGFWFPVYVYEFDTDRIPDSDLVKPERLFEQYHVDDAVQNSEHWLLAESNPKEIRYEFVGGGFLPPDDVCEYAEALKLKFTTEVSAEAMELEEAVLQYNLMCAKGPFRTCDQLFIRFIDELAEARFAGKQLASAFIEGDF